MKFAPNSFVLEILSVWLGLTVSDPFALTIDGTDWKLKQHKYGDQC